MSRLTKPVKERILARTTPTPTGCFQWNNKPKKNGRPYITVNGVSKAAYRALWEVTVGEIPVGMTIDHTCFNKLCLNIEHMEVVTMAENINRWVRKFQTDNPNLKCGHDRFGGTISMQRGMTRKSGVVKMKRRCLPCFNAYQVKRRERLAA